MYNKIITKLFVVTALLVSINVFAAPEIQHWQTSNGSDVYFVHAPELPMLDVKVVFDAGSARNGAKPGLAMFVASLLDEGADGLNADKISANFESLGANFGSSSATDSSAVSLRTLSDKTLREKALNNFIRVMSKPDFPSNAFGRIKNQALIGLRAKKQSPGSLAGEKFNAALYGDHPYGKPSGGTEESVNAITIADVKAFHKQYYVSSNALIAMVGDISRDEAEQIANQLSNALPKGQKPTPIGEIDVINEAQRVELPHPSQQTHILVGAHGVKRGDPDYYTLYLGNHVLGGGGMVSRLFSEIREKRGLSYTAYSYFSPLRLQGAFVAGLQTKQGQTQEALDVLFENINSFIEKGPSEEELSASKKNITGGFPLRLDSNSKILDYIAMIGFYKLPLDYLNTFNDNIESITVEQIKDAFKRRLNPDKFVTVLVGADAKLINN